MPRTGRKHANRRYWREYSNLQSTKHALIQCYLNGWLPKLGSWSGRILYLDTHAGRGRHLSGEYGSPLVAVKAALEHKYRDAVFGRCEIIYFFIEIDEENASALRKEIESVGPLPERIRIEVIADDCYQALGTLLDNVRQSNKKLALLLYSWTRMDSRFPEGC